MNAKDTLLKDIAAKGWPTHPGWAKLFTYLDETWARKLTTDAMKTYALAVGHHDPGTVFAAIVDHVATGKAEHRPRAGELAAIVAKHIDSPTAGEKKKKKPRPDERPDALRHVLDLHQAGEPTCSTCLSGRVYSLSTATGIVTCSRCNKLDPGQIDAAIELHTPSTRPAL